MRSLLLALVLLAPAFAQDDAAVKALIARYADARNHPDAPGTLAALFTAEADQLVSSGEWRKGHDAVARGTLASSESTGGKRTLTVESVRFLTPEVAIADCRYEITGLAGGQDRRMWSTFVVTRLSGGGWQIAAIRNMLPAAPAPAK
jgi:uncharacterized protein (TIGR02246 family)